MYLYRPRTPIRHVRLLVGSARNYRKQAPSTLPPPSAVMLDGWVVWLVGRAPCAARAWARRRRPTRSRPSRRRRAGAAGGSCGCPRRRSGWPPGKSRRCADALWHWPGSVAGCNGTKGATTMWRVTFAVCARNAAPSGALRTQRRTHRHEARMKRGIDGGG